MNKKNYIKPNMDVRNISNELILAASPSENLNNSDVIENDYEFQSNKRPGFSVWDNYTIIMTLAF